MNEQNAASTTASPAEIAKENATCRTPQKAATRAKTPGNDTSAPTATSNNPKHSGAAPSLQPDENPLLTFAPDALMQHGVFYGHLTQEQKTDILRVAGCMTDRRATLSEYCTPANAEWIFSVVDYEIGQINKAAKVKIGDPENIYPLLLSFRFDYATMCTKCGLLTALQTKMEALQDMMPDFLTAHMLGMALYSDAIQADAEKIPRLATLKAAAMSFAADGFPFEHAAPITSREAML